MGRPLKIKKSTTKDIGFNGIGTLTAPVNNSPIGGNEYFGVVGGIGDGEGVATTAYPVIKCRVYIAGEAEDDGFILAQKGSRKYLVQDTTGNQGVCILADEADGTLSEGNMNITFTLGDSTSVNIARLTNKFALDYSNNRYLVNFFTDEGTQVKSGSEPAVNLSIGIVENYTS